MKSPNWKFLAEFVGVTAIVASLIFVGLQVRQDREIAVSQNMLSIVEAKKHWVELMTANSSIWVKANSEMVLTPEEREIYRSMAHALEVQFFVDWFRARQVPGANTADTFAYEFAWKLDTNPGLLIYWQQKLDEWELQYEYTGVEFYEWSDSVNRALDHIRGSD
jgi:hypothetical protein